VDHRPASRRRRPALRALPLAALLAVLTACSNDQSRYPHQLNADYAESTSTARAVLLYVVAPLLIALLVSLPTIIASSRRRSRYRPQEGWDAEPVWFAGPDDPVTAVEQAQTGDVVRGGAGGSW
jgi:hypothetical protein